MKKEMNIARAMLEQKAHMRGAREEAAVKPLRIQPDHSSAPDAAFRSKVTFVILFFFS